MEQSGARRRTRNGEVGSEREAVDGRAYSVGPADRQRLCGRWRKGTRERRVQDRHSVGWDRPEIQWDWRCCTRTAGQRDGRRGHVLRARRSVIDDG